MSIDFTPRNICLAACSIPLWWLCFDIASGHLGANAIQALHIRLGDWALRFLWITLAISPIQTMTNWRGMSEYRQLFGLAAFIYASLHVLAYVWVDQAFVWSAIVTDIAESAYIWLGLVAYIILLALAITSPNIAKKRLGKNWKKLHRLIYLASLTAILHYFWQLKGNLAEPLFYLMLIFMLLAFRLADLAKSNRAKSARAAAELKSAE